MTADDHAVLLAHWTQPDVRRFLFDGAPPSAAEVAETIRESIGDFAARGYGIWLIELGSGPGSGTGLVGTAGLRPLEESGLEIFYSLAPGAWGHGYATEAARAVVEYGLGSLGLPEVLAEVDEGNAASVAVVKRLGMTPYAVVPGVLGLMTRYRVTAGSAYLLCRRGPKCRHDHRLKQHPKWKVDQLPDATFRWTTPAGRTYTTEPTRYPIKRPKRPQNARQPSGSGRAAGAHPGRRAPA